MLSKAAATSKELSRQQELLASRARRRELLWIWAEAIETEWPLGGVARSTNRLARMQDMRRLEHLEGIT